MDGLWKEEPVVLGIVRTEPQQDLPWGHRGKQIVQCLLCHDKGTELWPKNQC